MREKLVMIKSPFQSCYEVLCVSWVCGHLIFLELTQRHCHNRYTGRPPHHLTGSEENKRYYSMYTVC
jgi:hypothetical protein